MYPLLEERFVTTFTILTCPVSFRFVRAPYRHIKWHKTRNMLKLNANTACGETARSDIRVQDGEAYSIVIYKSPIKFKRNDAGEEPISSQACSMMGHQHQDKNG